MKIGKTIATAVGGSLILLQIANHKGYINVNWSKMNKDLDCATKKLTRVGSDPSIPQMLDKVFLIYPLGAWLDPCSSMQHDKSHLFHLYHLQLGSAFCSRKWLLFLGFFWWLSLRPSIITIYIVVYKFIDGKLYG